MTFGSLDRRRMRTTSAKTTVENAPEISILKQAERLHKWINRRVLQKPLMIELGTPKHRCVVNRYEQRHIGEQAQNESHKLNA